MNELKLVDGNFSGVMVPDTGDEHRFSWCGQEGRKATMAFFGESRCFVDVYRKHMNERGEVFYQFIETT